MRRWVVLMAPVGAAVACPDCPVAVETRQQVWSKNFDFNLIVTIIPFLVISVFILAIEVSDRYRRLP